MEKKTYKLWRYWAKALGEKIGDKSEADKVALIRTIIVLHAIITDLFIVVNIIYSWLTQ